MAPMTRVLLALFAIYAVDVVFGLANTVGYHRLLSHRAYKTTPWLRATLTILSAQYSGSPMAWVGAHRVHHTVSDTAGDPHTPTKGFWYAHAGWLIGTRSPILCFLFALSGFGLQVRFFVVDVLRMLGKNPPVWRQMTRDLEKERLMRWLDVPLVMSGFFALQVAAAWLVGRWWGIAWLWLAHFVMNNGTWIVNSACHWPTLGERPFSTRDQSRNVRWLAVLTHGEANHNAHHKYPRSARHGLDGDPDTSWAFIRALAWLGLAWDVQLPERALPARGPSPAPNPAAAGDATVQTVEESA
jgi:stearoyl-CoA desaturase (delta-9 desaturase)